MMNQSKQTEMGLFDGFKKKKKPAKDPFDARAKADLKAVVTDEVRAGFSDNAKIET